jgi:hypothetical protein
MRTRSGGGDRDRTQLNSSFSFFRFSSYINLQHAEDACQTKGRFYTKILTPNSDVDPDPKLFAG